MPTTDTPIRDMTIEEYAVLLGRKEAEIFALREYVAKETADANDWNRAYCKMVRERDEALKQAEVQSKDAMAWYRDFSKMMAERDDARRELFSLTDRFKNVKEQRDQAEQERDQALRDRQFARGEVVQEQTGHKAASEKAERNHRLYLAAVADGDRARAEVKRLTEIVTKQQGLIRDAEAKVANLTMIRARQRLDALAAAEAKTADIGWRKNRLVEAIEGKGFVVRWQPDGTPTISTPEEIEAEKRKAQARQEAEVDWFVRSTLGGPSEGLFAAFAGPKLEASYRALRGFPPKPQPAEDTVLATKPTPEVKTAAENTATLADALRPLYGPEGIYTRQREEQERKAREYGARFLATRATRGALSTPTGQPYYARAMRAVYGYTVNPATWGAVTRGVIARLDAALEAEMRQDGHPRCGLPGCMVTVGYRIWQQRPWKRA